MRKTYYSLLYLLFFCCISINSFAGVNDTADILSAATKGLKVYMAKIPAGKEKDWGFQSTDEMAEAKLGVPIEVFTLNPDFFSASSLVKDKNYIASIDEWMVPVTVNGEIRELITVSRKNNNWTAVAFGSAFLSYQLHYTLAGNLNLKNHPHALLRLYQLDCDFLLQPNSGETATWKAFPLTSAKKAFNLKESKNEGCLLQEVYTLAKNKAKK